MRRALPRAAFLFGVWAVFATPVVAQAPTPTEDPRAIAARVRARGEYVEELNFEEAGGGTGHFDGSGFRGAGGAGPRGMRPEARGGRDGLDGLGEARGGRQVDPPQPESRIQWPELSLPRLPLELLMWVGGAFLGGLLLVVIFFVVRELLQRRRPSPEDDAPALEDPPPPAGAAGAAPLPTDLGDPDALAADGRWGDAILALLVESLKLVGWEPERQRAMTAREVHGALARTDARRAPLGEVVFGAERVRFAGAPADQATFQSLRPWWVGLRGGASAAPTADPAPASAPTPREPGPAEDRRSS